jgi:putative hydrolase of the HAD superfamily
MGDAGMSDRTGGAPGLRGVLFDAGNTLIRTSVDPAQILRELCGQLGVSIDLAQAREAYHQSERFFAANYLTYEGGQDQFWVRYHGEALRHLEVADPTGEKAAFLSHGFGVAGVWRAYPEAPEVCRRLKSLDLKLGVVSNGPLEVSEMLSSAGLLPFFDSVVTSQGARIEKPDPRIFHESLRILGLSPDETLFVGDLYDIDVVGARAAGIAAVLIDRKGRSADLDCPIIRSLEELIPMVAGKRVDS